jgi:hypothetical protein
MKLQRIYKIVADYVDDTMPSQEVMNITKEVAKGLPDDEQEVMDELYCLQDEGPEIGNCNGEDEDEGIMQDPDFRGLCE